jgi:hypothetical protein
MEGGAMVLTSIEDNLGKIIVLVGALLLVGYVLSLTELLGSLLSPVFLFSGIVLVYFGAGLQLGFFSGGIRNLGGVGTVFISISVVCFAFSMAAAQFHEVYKVLALPEGWRQTILGWWYVPVTRPVFAWFSNIMLYASIITVIPGIALKVLHAIRWNL